MAQIEDGFNCFRQSGFAHREIEPYDPSTKELLGKSVEVLILKLEFKNISAKRIYFEFGQPIWHVLNYHLSIYDAAGKEVEPVSGAMCILTDKWGPRVRLRPNQTFDAYILGEIVENELRFTGVCYVLTKGETYDIAYPFYGRESNRARFVF